MLCSSSVQLLLPTSLEKKVLMNHYESISTLTVRQMEEFLDQVYLTGFNRGHQSVVEPDLADENPFDEEWLSAGIEDSPALVENEAGEELIIDQLHDIVEHVLNFDVNTIPDDLSWSQQVIMPKSTECEDEES